MQHLIETIPVKNLFLIDGIGAFITAIMTGYVLTSFEALFGMPIPILYVLSAIAGVYCIFSCTCFLKIKDNWQPFLKGIAIANIAYCCLTVGLLFYLHSRLTMLGMLYFIIEVLIVVGLATIEIKKSQQSLERIQ